MLAPSQLRSILLYRRLGPSPRGGYSLRRQQRAGGNWLLPALRCDAGSGTAWRGSSMPPGTEGLQPRPLTAEQTSSISQTAREAALCKRGSPAPHPSTARCPHGPGSGLHHLPVISDFCDC